MTLKKRIVVWCAKNYRFPPPFEWVVAALFVFMVITIIINPSAIYSML